MALPLILSHPLVDELVLGEVAIDCFFRRFCHGTILPRDACCPRRVGAPPVSGAALARLTRRLTKVNRCLTEGRPALAVRLAGIEGGIECAKLAPQLSALADDEATAADLALLRAHMKTCLESDRHQRQQTRAKRRTKTRPFATNPLVPSGELDPTLGRGNSDPS
jgi:hypothetical protein